MPNVSTWGAGVIHDEQGRVHAYAAEMSHNCGITSWQSNSQCVHYSAESAMGPFERHEVVLSTFCHNPAVTAVDDESGGLKYLLYHIGDGTPKRDPCTNCSSGFTNSCPSLEEEEEAIGEITYNKLLEARSPSGPWKEVDAAMFWSNGTPGVSNGSTTNAMDNPAPLTPRLPNDGSFMGLFAARARYQDTSKPSPPGCGDVAKHCSQLGVARGPSYKGPYVIDSKPVFGNKNTFCEDPVFWRDVDGSYHGLCNSKSMAIYGNGHGMHTFSQDGVDWKWHDLPAYTKTVTMTDGTEAKFGRRERPKILFAPDGSPSHLFTSVSGPPGDLAHTDRCYTLAQSLVPPPGESIV